MKTEMHTVSNSTSRFLSLCEIIDCLVIFDLKYDEKRVNRYKALEKYKDFRMQQKNTHPIARFNSESCNETLLQFSSLTIPGKHFEASSGQGLAF